LELANLHIPMEKLPKQLYSLSVSATVYDVASLAEFSQGWTAQLRHLAEQCPDFSSLQLAISIVNLDQILTIMLRLLSEIALPRLEHLIVHFRSDVFKPYVTDAGQAEIREALSRCRARSSSLWHVELHGSHRFGKRSVVDFSSR
jgi:hypothetical protein